MTNVSTIETGALDNEANHPVVSEVENRSLGFIAGVGDQETKLRNASIQDRFDEVLRGLSEFDRDRAISAHTELTFGSRMTTYDAMELITNALEPKPTSQLDEAASHVEQ